MRALFSRKYRNIPTVVDGIRYDSKLEAQCANALRLLQTAGEILWFVRQVTFELEGGVKYRCDFLAVKRDGVQVIDATGMLTQVKKNKLKQVKARYGVTVLLYRGKFRFHPFDQRKPSASRGSQPIPGPHS